MHADLPHKEVISLSSENYFVVNANNLPLTSHFCTLSSWLIQLNPRSVWEVSFVLWKVSCMIIILLKTKKTEKKNKGWVWSATDFHVRSLFRFTSIVDHVLPIILNLSFFNFMQKLNILVNMKSMPSYYNKGMEFPGGSNQ